jgi:integrase
VLRFLRASGLVCKRNGEQKFEKYVVKMFREGASYQSVVKAFYGFRAFANISGWKLWRDESPELLLRGYKRWHASVKKPVVRRVPLSLGDMRLLGKRVNRAALMEVRDFVMCLLGFRAFMRSCELVALVWKHVKWTTLGCKVFISNSKTDQLYVGFWVEFEREADVELCVVTWLRRWHSLCVGMQYVFPKCV